MYSAFSRLFLLITAACGLLACESAPKKKEWALAVHGGAGKLPEGISDADVRRFEMDMKEALAIGSEILSNGGAAVDAVEQVIRYLEDNPRLNAGKGAVFTHDGRHELDAALMLGNTREAGAVCGVTAVKNPISLARKVMEQSKHVLLSSAGAEAFASTVGVERVDPSYFFTDKQYEALQKALEEDPDAVSLNVTWANPMWGGEKYGTVGCVALDREGNLVAGTSTGGLTNKKYGRVGDVPLVGAGTYADERVAVSMTGWGEKILLAVCGHSVAKHIQYQGCSLEKAGAYVLSEVLEPETAGMIAVDRYGNTFTDLNTEAMLRGSADSDGRLEVAVFR